MPRISKKKILIYIFLIILISFPKFVFSVAAQETTAAEDPVSVKEKMDREGYILNLKQLINESKKKIEKVNDKLQDQARDRRNQQREERAREYYEKAKRLFDEGRFEEAKILWEKAIKVTEHPEMEDYVSKSVRKTKKLEKALEREEDRRLKRLEVDRGYSAKEVEKTYQRAVSLYNQRKYLAAQEDFELVDEMFPDHKATRSYLMLIQRSIQEEQDTIIAAKLQKESVFREKEKKKWKEDLEKEEEERKEKLKKQVSDMYKEAVDLYRSRKFELSKAKFKEVEWISPDYKKTVKYLKRIDKEIQVEAVAKEEQYDLFGRLIKKEKLDGDQVKNEKPQIKEQPSLIRNKKEISKDEAADMYKEAVHFYKKDEYNKARANFVQVNEFFPGYKQTEKYLKRIDKKLSRENTMKDGDKQRQEIYQRLEKDDLVVQEAVDKRQQKFVAEAESKYEEALRFYKQKNYVEAKIKFIQVEAIYPNYKETISYLASIDEDIEKQKTVWRSDEIKGAKDIRKVLGTPKEMSVKPVKEMSLEKDEQIKRKDYNEEADDIYRQAVTFYQTEQYGKAHSLFLDVEKLAPGYKKTKRYLKKLSRIIKKKDKATARVDKKLVKMDDEQKENYVETKFPEDERHAKKIERKMEKLKRKELKKRERQFVQGDRALRKEKDKQSLVDDQRRRDFEKKLERAEAERGLSMKNITELGVRQKKVKDKVAEQVEYDEKAEKKEKAIIAREQEKSIKRLELEKQNLVEQKKEAKQIDAQATAKIEELRSRHEEMKKDVEEAKRRAEEAKQRADELSKQIEEAEYQLMVQREDRLRQLKELLEAQTESEENEQMRIERKRMDMLSERKEELEKLKEKLTEDEQAVWDYEYQQLKTDKEREYANSIRKQKLKEQKEKERIRQQEWEQQDREIEKALTTRSKEEKDRLIKEANELYKEALDLYREQDFVGARAKFFAVDSLIPGYRAAKIYAERAQNHIDNMKYKEEVDNKEEKNELQKEILEDNINSDGDVSDQVKTPLDTEIEKAQARIARYEQRQIEKQLKAQEKQEVLAVKDNSLELIKERESLAESNEDRTLKEEEKDLKLDQKKQLIKDSRKEAEERRVKIQVNALLNEILTFTEQEKALEVKEKQQQFDHLLEISNISSKYKLKMQRKLQTKQAKVLRDLEKQKRKMEVISKKREIELSKDENRQENLRQQEMSELTEKIKREEERLQKEREKYKDVLGTQRSAKSSAKADESDTLTERFKRLKAEKKSSGLEKELESLRDRGEQSDHIELEKIVVMRQAKLKKDRERIQQEFDANIERLYDKAVATYRSGRHEQAKELFLEIDSLKPDYKKSHSYLSKIEEKLTNKIPKQSLRQQMRPQVESEKSRRDVIFEALDSVEKGF